MPTYTYQCEKCELIVETQNHREAPFEAEHFIRKDEESKFVKCNGKFYRVWKSTSFYMKDHSSSNWE